MNRTTKIRRALNRFERAVENKAFEGTIPWPSDDPKEERAMLAAHAKIARDYSRARRLVCRYMLGDL